MTNWNHPDQERIEELCALNALGELSLEDARELNSHLARCPDCRELLGEFQRIVLDDLPLVAASRVDEKLLPVPEDVEVQKALDRVLRKAERGTVTESGPILRMPPLPLSRKADSYWHMRLLCAAAAMVLCCVASFGYRAFLAFENDMQHSNLVMRLETEYWKRQAAALSAQQHATEAALKQAQANADATRASLQASLQKEQSQDADLLKMQRNLEGRIAADMVTFSLQSHQLQLAQASLEQEQQTQRAMSNEIQSLKARPNEQQRDALAAPTPRFVQSETVAKSEPKVTTSEARDLFGARDLHIVDVFDVNSSGNTRKIYGRVYYVDKHLLLFYAFDLQDTKHDRAAAGFQAWGFRQPNSSKPENLGMFYVDDASLNRWALKVTNTALLARIDTVFVTAEPPTGSASPKGKKILFASLAGPPNHP